VDNEVIEAISPDGRRIRDNGTFASSFCRNFKMQRIFIDLDGRAFGLMLALGAGLAGLAPRCADAQAPSSFGTPASKQINNPTVSPYLNLTQPGIDPAIAYQTLVRPENQIRDTLANQSQAIGNLQYEVGQSPSASKRAALPVRRTGHPTTFMSTGTYFPAMTGGQMR
jgi:hypothetical protein